MSASRSGVSERSGAREPRTALICSAGGAMAFAHLGFLDELDRAGVTIESFGFVCGVSGGALALLPVAAGWSPRQAIDFARREICTPDRRRSIPFSGAINLVQLLRGRLYQALQDQFPELRFDELRCRLRTVSYDLVQRKPSVDCKGRCLEAILATTCVPLAARPLRWRDSWYIDGAAYSSLPAGLLRRSVAIEQVIAVDVARVPKQRSSRTVFCGMEFPISFAYPLSVRAEFEHAQRASCDLTVRPDVEQYSFTDFSTSTFDALIDVGRDAARDQLGSIKRLLQAQERCSMIS